MSSSAEHHAAELAAARRNAKEAQRAPLLAHADLAEKTTAEAELQRRIDVKTTYWWDVQARAQLDAQHEAEIAWHRFVLADVAGESAVALADAWARPHKPLFVTRENYRTAVARVLAGKGPIPPMAKVRPSACWPMVEAILPCDALTLRAEWARHDVAGCTRKTCFVLDPHAVADRATALAPPPAGRGQLALDLGELGT